MNRFTLIFFITFIGLLVQPSILIGISNTRCRAAAISSLASPGEVFEKSVAATEDMKRICEHMKQSCCSDTKVYNLAQHYLQGRAALENVRLLNSKISKLLDGVDAQNIMALVNEDVETCLKEADVIISQEQIEITLSRRQKTEKLIDEFVSNTAQLYAGFACSVCSADNADAFYDTQRRSDDLLSYDFDNYIKALSILRLFTEIEADMRTLASLAYIGLCKEKVSATLLDEFKAVSQTLATIAALDMCMLLDADALNDEKHSDCVTYFSKAYAPNSVNFFAGSKTRYQELLEGLRLLRNEVSESLDFESFPDNIVFYPVISESTFDNGGISIVFGLPHSLKLADNTFSQSIWQNRVLPVFAVESKWDIDVKRRDNLVI